MDSFSDLIVSGGAVLAERCVVFGRFLRSAGVVVTPPQIVEFLRCLPYVDTADRSAFKDAARATLLCRHEQLPIFDAVFDAYWSNNPPPDPGSSVLLDDRRRPQVVWAIDSAGLNEVGDDDAVETDRANTFSALEQLRRRDFGALGPEELAAIRQAMQQLALRTPLRRRRRLAAAAHGEQIDLRRTWRASLRYGGMSLRLARRTYTRQRRPLVLLCDVSGSMECYARLLLQFVHVAARRHTHLEAFVFSTRLTRVTRQLRMHDAEQALDAAGKVANDWGGGTRIGAALKTFNFEWARRVLGHGALVMIISDGCDRGDPNLLAQETARLQRSCHRLIWLNPWLGQAGYEPRVRGMQAALPYVDVFLPVHNLASLEQLAQAVEEL